MAETINGFNCTNCNDVHLARRGIDPARPDEGPPKSDVKEAEEKRRTTSDRGPAVEVSEETQQKLKERRDAEDEAIAARSREAAEADEAAAQERRVDVRA